MKTRPFNLEEALNGAKVITRDGLEVTQLTKFEGVTTESYSLVGVMGGYVRSWADDGRFDDIFGKQQGRDLFLAVEPNSVWVNVYQQDGIIQIGGPFKTKKEALIYGENLKHYIKTIEITDEL